MNLFINCVFFLYMCIWNGFFSSRVIWLRSNWGINKKRKFPVLKSEIYFSDGKMGKFWHVYTLKNIARFAFLWFAVGERQRSPASAGVWRSWYRRGLSLLCAVFRFEFGYKMRLIGTSVVPSSRTNRTFAQ